jgi:hypothetical protein
MPPPPGIAGLSFFGTLATWRTKGGLSAPIPKNSSVKGAALPRNHFYLSAEMARHDSDFADELDFGSVFMSSDAHALDEAP